MEKSGIFSQYVDKISKIKPPEQFFDFIEDKVTDFFKVSYLGIIVLNDSETEYIVKKEVVGRGITRMTAQDIRFGLNDNIIMHLLDKKKAILTKDVVDNIRFEFIENRRIFLLSLINRLNELEVEACVPGFVRDKLVTVFILGKKISGEGFSVRELELFSSLAQIKAICEINNNLEKKDLYTKGHADRVARFSMIVGRKLCDELEKIPYGTISLYYAAELHDVGKINLPDSILKKKNALSDEEFKEVKKHPLDSVMIINPLEKWFGETILDAVLYHHENYDGSGYPYGIKGDQINILAGILRVADSFDAMITNRPYRKELIQHKVLSELIEGRGVQFDPRVIDTFLDAYKQGLFRDIFFSQLKQDYTIP